MAAMARIGGETMRGKGIRIGKVSSVNYHEGTVDVIFADEEDCEAGNPGLFRRIPHAGN